MSGLPSKGPLSANWIALIEGCGEQYSLGIRKSGPLRAQWHNSVDERNEVCNSVETRADWLAGFQAAQWTCMYKVGALIY